MTANKHIVLLTLAALTLPLAGSTKNPITRPYRVHGTALWTVNPRTGEGVTYQVAESSHFGRSTAEGTGTWKFSGTSPALVAADIVTTLTSGGQSLWRVPGAVYQCEVVDPGSVTRGAATVLACGFNTVWMSEPEFLEITTDRIVFMVDYIGEGAVTY